MRCKVFRQSHLLVGKNDILNHRIWRVSSFRQPHMAVDALAAINRKYNYIITLWSYSPQFIKNCFYHAITKLSLCTSSVLQVLCEFGYNQKAHKTALSEPQGRVTIFTIRKRQPQSFSQNQLYQTCCCLIF